MILPTAYERPDRVQACMYHRAGKCDACGFDGVHSVRFETLETRLTRIRCTCAWRGPIRRNYALAADDGNRHTKGRAR